MDRNKFYNKYLFLFSLALAITAGLGAVFISFTVGKWDAASCISVSAMLIPVFLGGGALITEYTYRNIRKKIENSGPLGGNKEKGEKAE